MPALGRTGACVMARSPWPRWGLNFESSTSNDELEKSFLAARDAAYRATAAVLSAGVALVHALLALKLHSQGQTALASAALATAGQQLLVWLLALLAPPLFARLRPALCAISLALPAALSSSQLASSSAAISCAGASGLAFWLSQLLTSGVPWLVVHAVLFPLGVNQSMLVHGLAVALLLSTNRQRCVPALEQCPAAMRPLQQLAALMQRLTLFSASPRSWLEPAAAAASGGSGGVDAGAGLRSCMAVYGTVQIAVGYLAVLQLSWWQERAARLAWLRHTDEVEAEWRLERRQRPPGTLLPELAVVLLMAWQAVDLWLGLAQLGGGDPSCTAAAPPAPP